jgi:hypothetical protein
MLFWRGQRHPPLLTGESGGLICERKRGSQLAERSGVCSKQLPDDPLNLMRVIPPQGASLSAMLFSRRGLFFQ